MSFGSRRLSAKSLRTSPKVLGFCTEIDGTVRLSPPPAGLGGLRMHRRPCCELSRVVVTRRPAPVHGAVITLTSLVERAGMTAGFDDYLRKPFQPLELLDAVAALLRHRRAAGGHRLAVLGCTRTPGGEDERRTANHTRVMRLRDYRGIQCDQPARRHQAGAAQPVW